MSLDCYPFGKRQAIGLGEPPMAIDVAYEDNLLICVTNGCRSIAIFELNGNSTGGQHGGGQLIKQFEVGDGVVIDQVIYCRADDYIACVGHHNELLSLYTIFQWRTEPLIRELDISSSSNTNNNNNNNGNDDHLGNKTDSKTNHSSHQQPQGQRAKLNCIDSCQKTGNLAVGLGDEVHIYQQVASEQDFQHMISIKLSMVAIRICLVENYLSVMAQDHVQVLKLKLLRLQIQSSDDDCITWNLNTKKLVKLPTLMHNTSNVLSTYHICHPLELLGPASESIACRVEAKLFSQNYCRNQLEPVVLLCKQFDLDKEPIKSAQLMAIYLKATPEQPDEQLQPQHQHQQLATTTTTTTTTPAPPTPLELDNRFEQGLLKSAEPISSLTCFLATLTNCIVYSLHGKKVVRLQCITNPDLCLDFRPDLFNIYLLTPLGLQICSTGICDSTFRYDWSSSSDLNLNFIACNQSSRCLTTKSFIILITSTANATATATVTRASQSESQLETDIDGTAGERGDQCLVEFMRKPSLIELARRIVHTVERCTSISIRSNLLTYLHANVQLELFRLSQANSNHHHHHQAPPTVDSAGALIETRSLLKSITIMLCKQLLQKKQANVITNLKLDKTIHHLLSISHCCLAELMQCFLDGRDSGFKNRRNVGNSLIGFNNFSTNSRRQDESFELHQHQDATSASDESNLESSLNYRASVYGDGDRPIDFEDELLKIYLKHSKDIQPILDYLFAISSPASSSPSSSPLPSPGGEGEIACSTLINYLYELNPRHLIKCAQKYTDLVSGGGGGHQEQHQATQVASGQEVEQSTNNNESMRLPAQQSAERRFCLLLLGDKMKQLAELDSTGIDRSTVLFTLAILHNALGDQDQCLAYLGQIKPLKHLVITMCSNYENSHSIASLLARQYPDVYELFLNQLAKRDRVAASQFAFIKSQQQQCQSTENIAAGGCSGGGGDDPSNHTTITNKPDAIENEGDGDNRVPETSDVQRAEQPSADDNLNNETAPADNYELRLKLVSELSSLELADLLIGSRKCDDNNQRKQSDEQPMLDHQLADDDGDLALEIQAYLNASINLLESRFILDRLGENSH